MTIETKDVVAFSARLRTYQWGIEQDTLNQAADLIQSQSEHIAVLEGALVISVGALGRVNVRCFDRPSSPLKPLGDIAREALSAVAQTMGDEAYDEIATASLTKAD